MREGVIRVARLEERRRGQDQALGHGPAGLGVGVGAGS